MVTAMTRGASRALAFLVAGLVALTFSVVVSVAKADEVVITEEARAQFEAGVAHLEAPEGARYPEAYEAFRKAYAASPSPKILGNLGLAAMMIERDDEARRAYDRYLAEVADIDPRERTRITRDLATLRARAATVAFTVTPEAATIVDRRIVDDGPAIENRYPAAEWKSGVSIRAGRHELSIEAPDHDPAQLSFKLAPGERLERAVALSPRSKPIPSPDPAPSPAPPIAPEPPSVDPPSLADEKGLGGGTIAAIAITSVAVVGAVVVGALALSAKSDYEEFQSGGDRGEAEDIRATGEILNGVTDGLIVASVLGAGVSAVLLILDLSGGDETALVPQPGGVGLRF